MAQVSDEDLQTWFDQFNQQYFSGRLSKWKLVVGDSPDPDVVDVGGSCDSKTKTIYVTERSLHDSREAQGMLLHEMVHARVGGYHGDKFKQELTRLKNLGAPVSEVDFTEGMRPNADYVRERIDDALLEGLTLKQAQENAAWEYGMSRAALLHRFPGASKGSGSVDLLKKRLGLYPYDQYHAKQIALSLRNQGRTYRQIAADLTKAGYKTMGERSYSPGAVWHLLNYGRKAEDT